MNFTEDWLLNDMICSKINQLCSILTCGSCGEIVSQPVTESENAIYCQSCCPKISRAKPNKAWDHFVRFVKNHRKDEQLDNSFSARKDQKIYSHIKNKPDQNLLPTPTLADATQSSPRPEVDTLLNNISATHKNDAQHHALPAMQEDAQVSDDNGDRTNLEYQPSRSSSELGQNLSTLETNPSPISCSNDTECFIKQNEVVRDTVSIEKGPASNSVTVDTEMKNCTTPMLGKNDGWEISDELPADQTVSDNPALSETALTVQTAIKRKDGDNFHTPKSKRIALDSELLNDLVDSNPTDIDAEEVVQISMKDLKDLLRTAKKKARQEVVEHMQSTVKKGQPNSSLLVEEGIVPFQTSDALGVCQQNHLDANTEKNELNLAKKVSQSESEENDSDSDSFVPPTPKSNKKPVITSIMATGLTAAHKAIVGKSLEEFMFKFSARLSSVDILVVGQRQVTLKWIYARVEGIPIVTVDWLDQSLQTGELLPLDDFILEKSFAVPVPKIFKSLDIALCPAFTKYSEPDLMMLLKATGAEVNSLDNWKQSRSIRPVKPLRMLVGDNASIAYSENQLINLSGKFKSVVVDISYLLGILESGRVKYLQPSLLVQVSDQLLARLGFPAEMITPEE